MHLPTQARHCKNCYHMLNVCKKSRDEPCPDYEHRQQGIRRQVQITEAAMARTIFSAMLLVVMTVSPVVWANF